MSFGPQANTHSTKVGLQFITTNTYIRPLLELPVRILHFERPQDAEEGSCLQMRQYISPGRKNEKKA